MARFVLLDRDTWTRPGERNDCTVRAIALACDLSYDEAYQVTKNMGRQKNRGFHVESAFYLYRRPKPYGRVSAWQRRKVNGASLKDWYHTPLNLKGRHHLTLGEFLDKHRTGRFIVTVGSHAIPIVDGAVLDIGPQSERRRVKKVYVLKVPRRRRKICAVRNQAAMVEVIAA